MVEKYQYRNIQLDENNIEKKIINSFDIDIEVESDNGWVPVSHLHTTQPYKVYKVELENGLFLECADKHLVFNSELQEIFVEDLSTNDYLFTINGTSKVKSITSLPISVGMFDLTIDTPEHRYYTNGILSHNTVVAGIFLTWFLIFHPDKNIMLAANKGDTAKEILDKVKSIISYLPFFLKPGLFSWNAYSIMTDANSRILATTTTDKAAIGFTIHLLFLDEFAHVRENIQRSFWDNIYPVMSADSKAKLIITSTPNGYELFQELYYSSTLSKEEGGNGFTNLKIPWWDVPGRDESWAEEQIAIMGEDAFNEQFACAFQRSDLLLLSPKQLNLLNGNITDFVHHEFDYLDNFNLNYENLLFKKTYDIENLKKDTLFFSIDLAEGLGKDYTVLQIFKLSPKKERDITVLENEVFQLEKHFYLEQIGLFRDNLTSIEDFAKIVYNLVFSNKFVDIDKIKIILEWNTYGSFFDEKLKNLYGGSLYDESVYLKTFHRKGAKRKNIGLKQNKESKPRNCAELKSLIDNRTIMVFDKWTCGEFKHFNRNKKGSFEASTGHDDTVMACVNLVEIFRDVIFIDMVAETFELLADNYKIHINNLMENGNSLDESTDFLSDDFNENSQSGLFGDLNDINGDNIESWL